MKRATKKPETPPRKSEGAKIPPTPPLPVVTVEAITLNAIIKIT